VCVSILYIYIYIYRVSIVQAYQTSQYVVPRGGIVLGKWCSSFAGNSDGKMNVESACALITRDILYTYKHNTSKDIYTT
jgi:hypothetical protein